MSKQQEIIDALCKAYTMEMETVTNYLACSVNLDGVRAEEIKKALAADIQGELMHAQRLGARIKTLGGTVPGSLSLNFGQRDLQPQHDTTDVVAIIKGVIHAEDTACQHYQSVIKLCEGLDYVTQELCIELLGMEEEHRRQFLGYLKEYEK
ncbi:MAG: ferritin-like domain-containing protein [Planctomycetes bacterium]|nr:ferritin-like domain-containing protein [Planctomycetota bacterium]